MAPRTLVIVNPMSRAGATAGRWASLERQLREALGTIEVEQTRGPRDAERLAREGGRAGIERIVVAGGDGTLSEVTSGLLDAGLGDVVEIGLLPLGTGGDFPRSLGLPRDLEAAIACIAAGSRRRVDAARIRAIDTQGREVATHFVNVMSAGISGFIVEGVRNTTRVLGGTAAFLIATLRGILRHRAEPVRLSVDGVCVHEGPLRLAAVANGRYFGGGMAVAPTAELDDGMFDVVWVPGVSRPKLVAKLSLFYRGRHLEEPGIGHRLGRVVEMEPLAGSVPIEVDGEPVGVLPVRIEILPNALTFVGPVA